MTTPPPWEPLVRPISPYESDGRRMSFEFRCPGCGRWGAIDDEQYTGAVSIDHTENEDGTPRDCTFHENIDCRPLRHLAAGEHNAVVAESEESP